MSVRDIDRGFRKWLQKLRRHSRKGITFTVGIQGAEASKDRGGITNAELAQINEFTPGRSFLRSTWDRKASQLNIMTDKAYKKGAAPGGNLRREAGLVGEWLRGEVVKTIDQSIGIRANAPSTIDRKGSSTPLIDSGVMKGDITSKVVG